MLKNLLKLLASNNSEICRSAFLLQICFRFRLVVSLLFTTSIDDFAETERIFGPDFSFTTLIYLYVCNCVTHIIPPMGGGISITGHRSNSVLLTMVTDKLECNHAEILFCVKCVGTGNIN